MANLHATADGNMMTPANWAVGSSVHQQLSHTNNSTITTSYVYCPTAVIANGEVVDGVVLAFWRFDSTGTISVSLNDGSTDVREVTINVSDLVLDASNAGRTWVFFKFGSTVTGNGVTSYKIGVKSSSSTQAVCFRSSTTADWARSLRTTTAAGAIAAGDAFFVCGEYTAPATSTSRTTTMNSTAATDYGAGVAGRPAFVVGSNATLTWDVTQSTTLRLSGNLDLSGNANVLIGTTGSPVPRAYTAVLEFDCGADGDYALVNNGGTLTMQGESRTSGKNVIFCKLDADAAATDTTLTVDTDTGWKSGDEVAIAATSQTRTQHERKILNGDAGGSSFAITVALTNAHRGSGDTKGGIILLTRNVVIRTVNTSFQTYLNTFVGTSVVDLDWVQLKNCGYSGAGKDGCGCNMLAAAGGSMETDYVVVDGYTGDGFNWSTSCTFGGWVVRNCAAYNGTSASTTNGAIRINSTMKGRTFSVDGFYAIHCPNGLYFNFPGSLTSKVKNVYISGPSNYGFKNAVASAEQLKLNGNFDNWEVHSSTLGGMLLGTAAGPFTFDTWKIWACTDSGIAFTWQGAGVGTGSIHLVNFNNFTVFGSAASAARANIEVTSHLIGVVFENLKLDGGAGGGATTNGFIFGSNSIGLITTIVKFINCEFSNGASPKTALAVDVAVTSAPYHLYYDLSFEDCIFNGTLAYSAKFAADSTYDTLTSSGGLNPSRPTDGQRLRFTNTPIGGVLHKTVVGQRGVLQHNTSTFKSASPSEELVPVSTTRKLASQVRRVPVLSGNSVSLSVWVRKDGSYNGNAPRLVVLANSALGVTEQVLDTLSVGANTWEQLTAVTSAVAADGVLSFYVDCDGTAGSAFTDDWTA